MMPEFGYEPRVSRRDLRYFMRPIRGYCFSSRRRHPRWTGDWSSDVCSSDLAAVVAGQRDLFALGDGIGIAVDLARQCAAKAREMGAAVALRNVVGEAQHILMIAVVPP